MRIATRARTTLLITLCLACLGCLTGLAGAQEFDRLVPETTIAYISVENLDRTRERFERSPLKSLWDDPAVQQFLEMPLERWSKEMETQRKEDGVTAEEVFAVIHGRVAVAITSMTMGEDGEEDVGIVLLAEVGDNRDEVADLIERAEQRRLEDGKQRRFEEDFLGVTIVFYRDTESEEGDVTDAWFLDRDMFATAPTIETLRKVLVMREGGEVARLSDNEIYRRARARTGERGDLFFYIGMKSVMAAIEESVAAKKAAKDEKGAGFDTGFGIDADFKKIMDALGLNGLDAVAAQSRLGREGLTTDVFVAAPGAKEGLLKLFDGKNSALMPPAWVPEDAIGATTMALDFQELWKEAKRVADRIRPGTSQMMDGAIQGFKAQVGIDLEQDLIGSLGKEVTWYMKAAPDAEEPASATEATMGATIPQVVMALEVTNKSKLEGLLNIAQAMSGGAIQIEEYLGMRIRTIATPIGLTPAIALLPDQFVLAVNVEDLKDILRRFGKDVKGMRDSAEFARALERMPPSRMLIVFSREAKALRQSVMMNSINVAGESGKAGVDMSLFPSAEVLEKYLGIGLAAMVNEEGGIYYRYFLGFTPPEEDAEGRDGQGDRDGG